MKAHVTSEGKSTIWLQEKFIRVRNKSEKNDRRISYKDNEMRALLIFLC